MKALPKIIIYSILAAAIILIDRISKIYALYGFVERYTVNQFFSCQLVFNRGISWGFLYSHNPVVYTFVSSIIALVTVALLAYAIARAREGRCIAGEIMVVAGSFSNIYDRVMYGGVIDFVECSYYGYAWPVFNVADVAIVLGVALMMYLYVKGEE